MNPPSGLDATARALWRRVIADLQQREQLRDVDASAVERYVRAEQVARLAWARVAKREKTEGASAWRSRGSHGGMVIDIDVQIAQKATREAASYAADLGITPASRRRLGVDAAVEDDSLDADLDRALSLRVLPGGRGSRSTQRQRTTP
jgi:P27 family predicted phage terminase small subunit